MRVEHNVEQSSKGRGQEELLLTYAIRHDMMSIVGICKGCLRRMKGYV